MNVLVACECSQVVTRAFLEYGNFVISADLKCSEILTDHHYVGDCFDLINGVGSEYILQDGSSFVVPYWDLLIAHPPCTYLSSAGLYLCRSEYDLTGERSLNRDQAAEFFMRLYDCWIPHRCIENPRGYINSHIVKPSQEVYPYYFGDRTVKRTDLWLVRLPLLLPDDYVEPEAFVRVGDRLSNPFFVNTYGLSPNRRRAARSVFHSGLAGAMARQWSEELLIFY